jgi:translation initiation factor IF-3
MSRVTLSNGKEKTMTLGFNQIELEKIDDKTIVTITFKDKVDKEDYDLLLPQLEGIIEKGNRVRLLIVLDEFKGWSMGAAWEDTKFGLAHFNDIEKIAITGEKKWERLMAVFLKPFTRAVVQYFQRKHLGEARTWVQR